MKLIFLDTEFSDLYAREPKLASIGLMPDTGKEAFYAELPRAHWGVCPSGFFLAHVAPRLQGGNAVMEYWELARNLRAWLDRQGECVLVSDAPEFDYRFLLELNGELLEPISPPPCRYFGKTLIMHDERFSEIYETHYDKRTNHHALRDAQLLMETYHALLKAGWEGIKGLA